MSFWTVHTCSSVKCLFIPSTHFPILLLLIGATSLCILYTNLLFCSLWTVLLFLSLIFGGGVKFLYDLSQQIHKYCLVPAGSTPYLESKFQSSVRFFFKKGKEKPTEETPCVSLAGRWLRSPSHGKDVMSTDCAPPHPPSSPDTPVDRPESCTVQFPEPAGRPAHNARNAFLVSQPFLRQHKVILRWPKCIQSGRQTVSTDHKSSCAVVLPPQTSSTFSGVTPGRSIKKTA